MERSKKLDEKRRLLLERLIKLGYLKDKRLFKAFMETPLEEFIPSEYREPARLYEDMPSLFYFQNEDNFQTISAPHMISIMIQGLVLDTNDDLLILGAKSGYIASLAHKLAPKGEIIILEANSDIAKITMDNLQKLGMKDNITVIVKNPLEGMPELSPWQKILVTGAINQDRINPLLRQLDPKEGVLYAPIGEDYVQIYTQILRLNEEYFGKKQLQVRFTPLMTQVELDELQLITDLDEVIEVKEDPVKVDDTLNKISIKYTSSILDNIDFKPVETERAFVQADKEEVIALLEKIEEATKRLKKQDEIEVCFECIDDIDGLIDRLKDYKSDFDIKIKRIQSIINQITSYYLIRRDLEKEDITDQAVIDKKLDILNVQLAIINDLIEGLREEIKRIKAL